MLCAITGEPLSAPNGYRMPTLPEPLGRSHAPWPRGHRRRLGRGLLAARGQILRAAGSRISPAENRPCPRLVLIDILVFDGLDEMDAWGPAEVFRSAGKRGSDMETRLVTRQAQDTVLGAYGLRFVPDGIFEPGAANVLVVPGGGWAARDEAGAWGEVQRGDLAELLGEARQSTSLMAGVCTGTMLLAQGARGRLARSHHVAVRCCVHTCALLIREHALHPDGRRG